MVSAGGQWWPAAALRRPGDGPGISRVEVNGHVHTSSEDGSTLWRSRWSKNPKAATCSTLSAGPPTAAGPSCSSWQLRVGGSLPRTAHRSGQHHVAWA